MRSVNPSQLLERAVFALFLVYVATLAVQKPAVYVFLGKLVSASDLIFPLLLFSVLILFLTGERRPKRESIYAFFGLYVAAFLFASFFAPDARTSFIKTFATAYLVGSAMLALNIIDSMRRLELTMLVWLASALVPVGLAIAGFALFYLSPESSLLNQLTYHYGAVPIGNFPRLSSTFVSASMFCNYLTVSICLLFAARSFWNIGKAAWLTMFVLIVFSSVFTVSIGLGAFVLGLALWYHHSIKKGTLRAVALYLGITFCALTLFAAFVAFEPHSTAPFTIHVPLVGIEVFPSSRLLVWTEAAKTFAANLLTGNGPGMPSASVIFQNTDGSFSLLTDAHNSYLSVAAQTGVFGLLALLALTAVCIRTGFFARPISKTRFALATAFLCGSVLQGMTGSFEDARHLWVLVGMLIAAARMETSKEGNSAAEF